MENFVRSEREPIRDPCAVLSRASAGEAGAGVGRGPCARAAALHFGPTRGSPCHRLPESCARLSTLGWLGMVLG